MAKLYNNVSSHLVLARFRKAAPCCCHKDNACNPPLYDVKIFTGVPARVGLGHVIKEIRIKCTSCGKESVTDVECLEVYENQFNPK